MDQPLRITDVLSAHSEGLSFALPLFETVRAGFASLADNAPSDRLDINQLIVKHPAATFFVRVEGDSMKHAQISSGDILVVDRALEPVSGKIVVAILNGEFTVKRFILEGQQIKLQPENPKFPPILITPETDFEVWGVVTYVIHKAS